MTRTNSLALASAEATLVALTHFGPRDERGMMTPAPPIELWGL
jgi:hypothetical protein